MNNAQKTIKYVAIAFAIFLIITIISGIITSILTVLGVSHVINVVNGNVETMNYTKEYTNIYSIEMDIAAAEIEIKSGDTLKIDATDIPVDYTFEVKDGILSIENKKASNNAKLVIYVPNNMKKLDIDIGAGKVYVDSVTVENLDLEVGAVTTDIKELVVMANAKIDAGVGNISINDSDISNLDINSGVGKVRYNGYLRGTNSVECVVGSMSINLSGTEEMYKITAGKAVGELSVNGTSLKGTQTIGEGPNQIKISGGIGSINITY